MSQRVASLILPNPDVHIKWRIEEYSLVTKEIADILICNDRGVELPAGKSGSVKNHRNHPDIPRHQVLILCDPGNGTCCFFGMVVEFEPTHNYDYYNRKE